MTQTYISLLRGINVGGKKKILMADLKLLYESLGFTNVKTYIQSGNVIFDSNDGATNELSAKKIEQKITDKYGFEVPVFVKTIKELEEINAMFPFSETDHLNPRKTYVTLLNEKPSRESIQILQTIDLSPDEYLIFDRVLFWYCVDSYTSKLSNNFFENKLKVVGTTRNWKTMNKLVEIANNKKTK